MKEGSPHEFTQQEFDQFSQGLLNEVQFAMLLGERPAEQLTHVQQRINEAENYLPGEKPLRILYQGEKTGPYAEVKRIPINNTFIFGMKTIEQSTEMQEVFPGNQEI